MKRISGMKKIKRGILLSLAMLMLCSTSVSVYGNPEGEPTEPTGPTYDPGTPEKLEDIFLYAETGVLMEQHSGKILYDMRGNKTMEPASTTKIMTLLVALEHGNLDDLVTVGDEITQIPPDSSKVPLLVGEQVTLRDLLYGLILRSGGDAAVSIAIHVSGSVEAFVDLMNQKADELGLTGTHFSNPHGYEDHNNYTTAIDLAKIARAGMDNEDFRTIVNTASYTINKNNVRENDLVIETANRFVKHNPEEEFNYPYGTGVKTGYFRNAQHTFVAAASKDGVDLIAVVLKSTQQGKWSDAIRLMDYGFAVSQTYSVEELYHTAPITLPVNRDDGKLDELALILDPASNDLNPADRPENIEKMKSSFAQYYTYEGPAMITEPVNQGDVVGSLVFHPENGGETRYNLLAAGTIEENAVDETLPNEGMNGPQQFKRSKPQSRFIVPYVVISLIVIASLSVAVYLQTTRLRQFMKRKR